MQDNQSNTNKDIEILKIDTEIIKSGVYNVSKIIVASVFSFIASILIARVVSRDHYGIYIFILAIFNTFSIFSIPGLKTVIFKASSQNYDGTYRKALNLSFKWSFVSVICLTLISLYFIIFNTSFYHYEIGISLLLMGIFSPIMYSMDMWKIILKGKQKFNISFFLTLIISITQFSVIFIFLILLNFRNALILIIIFVVLKLIFNILFTNFSKKYIKNKQIAQNWKKQGFALSIMDLSSIIFNSVGSFLIGVLLSLESAAIYGITLAIGNLFMLTIVSFIEVFLPRLYRSKHDFLLKDTLLFFFLGFVISLLFGFIIEYPIILLYTQKYSEVVFLCKIYLFIIPFRIISAFLGPYLIKHNMNKEINISKIITILGTILLYFLLIPLFRITGAVISSIGFYIIQDIIMTVIVIKHTKKRNELI